uniref:Uncharacterized protein n=1 Tax=Caenorhabditis japonica TaxID=281687 RepID=A0A8R1HQC4_CAEJA
MVPKQRSRHPAALDNIPVPFVSPPVPPQNPDLPPAYSSLTSQDCSLPSYETVVSGKVQYMYPSYSNVSN